MTWQVRNLGEARLGRSTWRLSYDCNQMPRGLLLSKGSTELDIQGARSMTGRWCPWSAASTAGCTLEFVHMASPVQESQGGTYYMGARESQK